MDGRTLRFHLCLRRRDNVSRRHAYMDSLVECADAAGDIRRGGLHHNRGPGCVQSLAEAQALLRDANEDLEETVQRRTAALRSEIAERQRLERAKVQAERLLERQEKLATLGTLTAGIAHEIRNPLTSLKARLYTLEKHLQAMPAARKDTGIISAEISRLERIVQDALSFARPADPKLELLAADTLLREVQGLMSTSLESRAVQVVVESDSGAAHPC